MGKEGRGDTLWITGGLALLLLAGLVFQHAFFSATGIIPDGKSRATGLAVYKGQSWDMYTNQLTCYKPCDYMNNPQPPAVCTLTDPYDYPSNCDCGMSCAYADGVDCGGDPWDNDLTAYYLADEPNCPGPDVTCHKCEMSGTTPTTGSSILAPGTVCSTEDTTACPDGAGNHATCYQYANDGTIFDPGSDQYTLKQIECWTCEEGNSNAVQTYHDICQWDSSTSCTNFNDPVFNQPEQQYEGDKDCSGNISTQTCYECVDSTLTGASKPASPACGAIAPAGHWTSDSGATCCSSCQGGVIDTKPFSGAPECGMHAPYIYSNTFMKVTKTSGDGKCWNCDNLGVHIYSGTPVELCPGETCAQDVNYQASYPLDVDAEICCPDNAAPVDADCGYCNAKTGVRSNQVKVCPQATYGCKTDAEPGKLREPFPNKPSPEWWVGLLPVQYTGDYCTGVKCETGRSSKITPQPPNPLETTQGATNSRGAMPEGFIRASDGITCTDKNCYFCMGGDMADVVGQVWGKEGSYACLPGTQPGTWQCRIPDGGSSIGGRYGIYYTNIGETYETDDTGKVTFTGIAPNTVTASTSDGVSAYLTGRVSKNGLIPNNRLAIQGNKYDENGSSAYAAKYNYTGSVQWIVYFNGSIDDQGSAIWYQDENLYVIGTTGAFNTTLNFTPVGNAYQSFRPGGEDVFIAKLDLNGNILWSTYFGTASDERGEGIAVDSNGSVYVAGHTDSASFPTAGSPVQGSLAGKNDSFVAKFNSTGSLVWSTYYGGSDDDIIYGGGLSVDANGNAILTGSTFSSDFPTTGGAHNTSSQGGQDAFIVKFSPTGAVLWSTYLGGSGTDIARQTGVDQNNNVFVAGETTSTNFPLASAQQSSFGGGTSDLFLTKFSSSGALLMSTYIGGTGDEMGGSLSLSAIGNAYVAGITTSSGLDTVDANLTYKGNTDGFLRKYDNAGELKHSTYLGGSGHDRALSVFVDWMEQIMVVGDTNSTDFSLVEGSPQTRNNPKGDGFMATYNFYPAPAMTTFNRTRSTHFIPPVIPDLREAPNVTLNKEGGEVKWKGTVRASLQDFDSNINLNNKFISIRKGRLHPTFDSPAIVTFTGTDCATFRLYYATGFHTNADDLMGAGYIVAGPGQVGGNCTDPTICTNIQCADNTLTFTAQHFDGFAEGEEGYNVPEFGTWALLIAVTITVAGLAYRRNKKSK